MTENQVVNAKLILKNQEGKNGNMMNELKIMWNMYWYLMMTWVGDCVTECWTRSGSFAIRSIDCRFVSTRLVTLILNKRQAKLYALKNQSFLKITHRTTIRILKHFNIFIIVHAQTHTHFTAKWKEEQTFTLTHQNVRSRERIVRVSHAKKLKTVTNSYRCGKWCLTNSKWKKENWTASKRTPSEVEQVTSSKRASQAKPSTQTHIPFHMHFGKVMPSTWRHLIKRKKHTHIPTETNATAKECWIMVLKKNVAPPERKRVTFQFYPPLLPATPRFFRYFVLFILLLSVFSFIILLSFFFSLYARHMIVRICCPYARNTHIWMCLCGVYCQI